MVVPDCLAPQAIAGPELAAKAEALLKHVVEEAFDT
jgi:hypothetical protein